MSWGCRWPLEGARAVWWPAAIVGVILVGLVVWQVTIPRNFYTGTDSVGVRSVVANLKVGETVCVPSSVARRAPGRSS